MDRNRFYGLIDAARAGDAPTSPSADPDELRGVLAALESSELIGFVVAFEDELVRLNRWSVWGAGFVSEGGLSDDGFHYFRSWLIGKGHNAVDAVLEDADSLADFLDDGEHENEVLEYVGVHLLEERGLQDARDSGDRPHADDTPVGDPFDEGTVEAEYPRVAATQARESSSPAPRRRGLWSLLRGRSRE